MVNSHTNLKKDISIIDDNGRKVSDPNKIANLFNEYFVNVGPNIDEKIAESKYDFKDFVKNVNENDANFIMSPTVPQEIYDIIKLLDNKKSLGPNSIPIDILKTFNEFYSEKLSIIINISFSTGVFPELCKLAKVIPIFKKNNQLLCENYRPISLLPIFSKIMEKVNI